MPRRFIILGGGMSARTGEYSKTEYTRRLPGHPENIVTICNKPNYSKARRRQMAKRPQVLRFVEVNKEAHAIFHDPAQKAEWEARHKQYLRETDKSREYVYVRLWDWLRHVLLQEKTAAAKSVQN